MTESKGAGAKGAPSKRGRTLRADGEVTRARILEAAGDRFAASGFAETANKAVAAAARVDLASINYHFGSRGGLYQAVLLEAHRRLIGLEELQAIAAAEVSAAAKLRRLIERLVDGAADERQSWHARVLVRELLSPTSHLAVLREKEIRPKLAVVLGILGEIAGLPAGDPALPRCLINVAAPCAILLVTGGSLPWLPGGEVASQEGLVNHLHTFAIAGLEAVGQARRDAREASGFDPNGGISRSLES